jgi:hypothetical protein
VWCTPQVLALSPVLGSSAHTLGIQSQDMSYPFDTYYDHRSWLPQVKRVMPTDTSVVPGAVSTKRIRYQVLMIILPNIPINSVVIN